MQIRKLFILTCTWCGACAAVNPGEQVREAAELAAGRTGQPPQWTAPWDRAEPAWDGETVLDVDDAVAAALRNNRALRADLETIGRAHADLVQAGLLSNPVVSLMVMFPEGGGRSMLRANALPMQPLADLWLIPARKAVAAAELQQAVLRVADRAVQTAAGVRRTYAELRAAERMGELIAAYRDLVAQSIQIIEARQIAGRATQVEANLARIRHERLRSDLLANEAQVRTLKHELLEQMGFAGASDRLRVAPLLELAAPADPPPLEDEAVAVAARRRLDLLAGEWNVEAARRQITLAQREGWPETAVGFSFERAPAGSRRSARIRVLAADAAAEGAVQGLTGGGPMPQAPQFAPRPRPVREVKYTLGPMIEMEIPIFDWNQAQTLRAIHEYNRRLAEYESLGQEVTRTVRQVLARQREAYEQVRLFREVIVPQVQANMELARQSYVAGQTDLTIYLAAQEDVIDTQRKALEFMRGYLVEQAALERAVGGRADAPPAPRVAAAASPLDESGTALEGVRR